MPNEILYVDQTVSVNGTTERLSSNGYYTGEHNGTPTQADAETAANGDAHYTEHNIVRYGTIAQDATAGSMPTVGIQVTQELTGCTSDTDDGVYTKNGAKTIVYTASTGYELPTNVTVKIGGVTATANTDYTWTKATGSLAFVANKLSDTTEITVTATASS